MSKFTPSKHNGYRADAAEGIYNIYQPNAPKVVAGLSRMVTEANDDLIPALATVGTTILNASYRAADWRFKWN